MSVSFTNAENPPDSQILAALNGLLNPAVQGEVQSPEREPTDFEESLKNVPDEMLPGMDQRKYQIKSKGKIVGAFNEGRRRGQLVMGTGGGKTAVAMSIVGQTKGRVLWLAPSKIAVNRGIDEAKRFCSDKTWHKPSGQDFNELDDTKDITFGTASMFIYGAKGTNGGDPEKSRNEEELTVEETQEIVRRFEHIDPNHFDLIIIDEAHRFMGDVVSQIADHFSGARQLFMTATPENARSHLDSIAPDRFDEYSADDLVDNEGYPEGIYVHRVVQGENLDKATVNNRIVITAKNERKALNMPFRYRVMLEAFEKGISNGEKVLGFLPSVGSSKNFIEKVALQQHPEWAGKIAHVDGSMKAKDIDAIYQKYRSGEILAVTCNALWEESMDVPDIKHVVLANPTTSKRRIEQSMGRACRKAEGKTHFYVWDVVSSVANMNPDKLSKTKLPISAAEVLGIDRVADGMVLIGRNKGKKLKLTSSLSPDSENIQDVEYEDFERSELELIPLNSRVTNMMFMRDGEWAAKLYRCFANVFGVHALNLVMSPDLYTDRPEMVEVRDDETGMRFLINFRDAFNAAKIFRSQDQIQEEIMQDLSVHSDRVHAQVNDVLEEADEFERYRPGISDYQSAIELNSGGHESDMDSFLHRDVFVMGVENSLCGTKDPLQVENMRDQEFLTRLTLWAMNNPSERLKVNEAAKAVYQEHRGEMGLRPDQEGRFVRANPIPEDLRVVFEELIPRNVQNNIEEYEAECARKAAEEKFGKYRPTVVHYGEIIGYQCGGFEDDMALFMKGSVFMQAAIYMLTLVKGPGEIPELRDEEFVRELTLWLMSNPVERVKAQEGAKLADSVDEELQFAVDGEGRYLSGTPSDEELQEMEGIVAEEVASNVHQYETKLAEQEVEKKWGKFRSTQEEYGKAIKRFAQKKRKNFADYLNAGVFLELAMEKILSSDGSLEEIRDGDTTGLVLWLMGEPHERKKVSNAVGKLAAPATFGQIQHQLPEGLKDFHEFATKEDLRVMTEELIPAFKKQVEEQIAKEEKYRGWVRGPEEYKEFMSHTHDVWGELGDLKFKDWLRRDLFADIVSSIMDPEEALDEQAFKEFAMWMIRNPQERAKLQKVIDSLIEEDIFPSGFGRVLRKKPTTKDLLVLANEAIPKFHGEILETAKHEEEIMRGRLLNRIPTLGGAEADPGLQHAQRLWAHLSSKLRTRDTKSVSLGLMKIMDVLGLPDDLGPEDADDVVEWVGAACHCLRLNNIDLGLNIPTSAAGKWTDINFTWNIPNSFEFERREASLNIARAEQGLDSPETAEVLSNGLPQIPENPFDLARIDSMVVINPQHRVVLRDLFEQIQKGKKKVKIDLGRVTPQVDLHSFERMCELNNIKLNHDGPGRAHIDVTATRGKWFGYTEAPERHVVIHVTTGSQPKVIHHGSLFTSGKDPAVSGDKIKEALERPMEVSMAHEITCAIGRGEEYVDLTPPKDDRGCISDKEFLHGLRSLQGGERGHFMHITQRSNGDWRVPLHGIKLSYGEYPAPELIPTDRIAEFKDIREEMLSRDLWLHGVPNKDLQKAMENLWSNVRDTIKYGGRRAKFDKKNAAGLMGLQGLAPGQEVSKARIDEFMLEFKDTCKDSNIHIAVNETEVDYEIRLGSPTASEFAERERRNKLMRVLSKIEFEDEKLQLNWSDICMELFGVPVCDDGEFTVRDGWEPKYKVNLEGPDADAHVKTIMTTLRLFGIRASIYPIFGPRGNAGDYLLRVLEYETLTEWADDTPVMEEPGGAMLRQYDPEGLPPWIDGAPQRLPLHPNMRTETNALFSIYGAVSDREEKTTEWSLHERPLQKFKALKDCRRVLRAFGYKGNVLPLSDLNPPEYTVSVKGITAEDYAPDPPEVAPESLPLKGHPNFVIATHRLEELKERVLNWGRDMPNRQGQDLIAHLIDRIHQGEYDVNFTKNGTSISFGMPAEEWDTYFGGGMSAMNKLMKSVFRDQRINFEHIYNDHRRDLPKKDDTFRTIELNGSIVEWTGELRVPEPEIAEKMTPEFNALLKVIELWNQSHPDDQIWREDGCDPRLKEHQNKRRLLNYGPFLMLIAQEGADLNTEEGRALVEGLMNSKEIRTRMARALEVVLPNLSTKAGIFYGAVNDGNRTAAWHRTPAVMTEIIEMVMAAQAAPSEGADAPETTMQLDTVAHEMVAKMLANIKLEDRTYVTRETQIWDRILGQVNGMNYNVQLVGGERRLRIFVEHSVFQIGDTIGEIMNSQLEGIKLQVKTVGNRTAVELSGDIIHKLTGAPSKLPDPPEGAVAPELIFDKEYYLVEAMEVLWPRVKAAFEKGELFRMSYEDARALVKAHHHPEHGIPMDQLDITEQTVVRDFMERFAVQLGENGISVTFLWEKQFEPSETIFRMNAPDAPESAEAPPTTVDEYAEIMKVVLDLYVDEIPLHERRSLRTLKAEHYGPAKIKELKKMVEYFPFAALAVARLKQIGRNSAGEIIPQRKAWGPEADRLRSDPAEQKKAIKAFLRVWPGDRSVIETYMTNILKEAGKRPDSYYFKFECVRDSIMDELEVRDQQIKDQARAAEVLANPLPSEMQWPADAREDNITKRTLQHHFTAEVIQLARSMKKDKPMVSWTKTGGGLLQKRVKENTPMTVKSVGRKFREETDFSQQFAYATFVGVAERYGISSKEVVEAMMDNEEVQKLFKSATEEVLSLGNTYWPINKAFLSERSADWATKHEIEFGKERAKEDRVTIEDYQEAAHGILEDWYSAQRNREGRSISEWSLPVDKWSLELRRAMRSIIYKRVLDDETEKWEGRTHSMSHSKAHQDMAASAIFNVNRKWDMAKVDDSGFRDANEKRAIKAMLSQGAHSSDQGIRKRLKRIEEFEEEFGTRAKAAILFSHYENQESPSIPGTFSDVDSSAW
jgi:superfamily II DNA or RNA helicase